MDSVLWAKGETTRHLKGLDYLLICAERNRTSSRYARHLDKSLLNSNEYFDGFWEQESASRYFWASGETAEHQTMSKVFFNRAGRNRTLRVVNLFLDRCWLIQRRLWEFRSKGITRVAWKDRNRPNMALSSSDLEQIYCQKRERDRIWDFCLQI